jgi:hypothetical protein
MRILFANWPFPHSVQSRPDLLLPWQTQQIFRVLNILMGLWKSSANSSSVAWKMLKVQFKAPSIIWMFFMDWSVL